MEERIRTTSSKGNEKGYKKEWIRLWKVKGRTFIGNKDHTFTFTISQSKNEKHATVYDLKLHSKKLKRVFRINRNNPEKGAAVWGSLSTRPPEHSLLI